MVGNFMFWKAVKNDCRKLYFKMDKLSKKDCFKRFERVFARNLSVQTRLQRCKVKKIQKTRLQNFKDTKIQGFYLIYFAVSLDLLSSLRYFLFRIEPQVWCASAHREVS